MQHKRIHQSQFIGGEAKIDPHAKVFQSGDQVVCVVAKGMRPPEGYDWRRREKSYWNTIAYTASAK